MAGTGLGGSNGYSIAVDASGNVYTTGYFQGTADFDPGAGTFNLTNSGGYDIFVQKLDALGNFLWAVSMGGTSFDIGFGIAVDASGNVYTTGRFSSTADFDPGAGTFNLTNSGDSDIFVQKLDASGNFLWAVSMGGTSTGRGSGIAVDASGNVYTTGHFQGTADFDPGAGTFNLTNSGGSDIFVQKLDASGNFLWAVSMGTTSFGIDFGIALDASGSVYTTGPFEGTVDFDPGAGTFNLTSEGSKDIFVQKLDASGNFLWAVSMGGTSTDRGSGIAVDASGNVYTTGHFRGTADFDPSVGAFNLTTAGSSEIFVQKLNTSGNFLWAVSMGGPGFGIGRSIAVDASGNVYTTGGFYSTSTADFDPGPGTFNLTSATGGAIFVSKLSPVSPAGELFESAAGMGGAASDYGLGIAMDASGNVYTTGKFRGTADFDPGAGVVNLASAGSDDVFVQKLDASDDLVWAKQMGGTGNDQGNSVAVDSAGDVYIAGHFNGTADFDPGAGTFNLTSAGVQDIFVQKLDASGNFVWAVSMGGSDFESNHSIAVDVSGNVCITGYFQGTADFDPGAGTANLTSVGGPDIFVSELDASGNFLWAVSMGGLDFDYGFGIALDASGSVYTTGLFEGTVDFDPGAGTVNLTSAGSADIFVQKLDVSGNFLWAVSMGGTGSDNESAIAVDAAGNVYTTGLFVGTVDFDPGAGTANLTSAGSGDIFVQKLDASGNFLWAVSMGGTSFETGSSVALDASGNVSITGHFEGTADFDPDAGTANLTSAGLEDIFVSQLDSSGYFLWAVQMGGADDDRGHSIAVDDSGNVYTTGRFNGTADFDPGAGTFNLISAGASDIFVSKLSRDVTPPVVTVDALVTNDTTPELTGTIDDASAVIYVTVSGPYPTQTHPAINNGTTWTLADNTLSSISPGIREVAATATDPSGNTATDATYDELTILGDVAGSLTSNLTPEQAVSDARLVLTAPAGTSYQWKKDGVNLSDSPPRVTGTTSQTLIIDPLEPSDSGAYTVEYQATAKRAGLLETDPLYLAVDLFDFLESSSPPAVPAAGPPALLVLGVLLSLAGAWSLTPRRATDS